MKSAYPERLVLLGHPLGHTLSPLIQNAALSAASIPLTYEPLDVPKSALHTTITELRRARAAGNVTIPYKEDMLAAADRCTETARAVGAVNTFWMAVDGALVGDNTDVAGFLAAVKQLIGEPRPSERVALIGAGGAAAAVLHAMEGWHGARVTLYNRTSDRADRLARRFGRSISVAKTPEEAMAGATLVVNATPVGLRGNDLPFDIGIMPDDAAVFDLAYRLGGTELVRRARAGGHRAMDGLTMLVEQGALAFERWFGFAPDRDAMSSAVEAASRG